MVFRTATGTRVRLVPGASASMTGLWYERLPDLEEMMFALHTLQPGDVFVDIGANQGAWSLLLAGHGASVHAFEPIPLTRQRLEANVALNAEDVRRRITVHAVALGRTREQATFTCEEDAGNHRLNETAGSRTSGKGEIVVEVDTADAVLAEVAPKLIKIDVEGEELSVLEGADRVLNQPTLTALIVETFRPHNYAFPTLQAIEARLARHGFRPKAYDPDTRTLRDLTSPSEGGQNTIYAR